MQVKIGATEIAVEADPSNLNTEAKVVAVDTGSFNLFTPQGVFHCSEAKPDLGLQDNHDKGNLTAPMNGTIVTQLVKIGAPVSKDETLMVMEAMKMEHAIIAPADGTVTEFFYQKGDLVDGGAELLAFAASEENQ